MECRTRSYAWLQVTAAMDEYTKRELLNAFTHYDRGNTGFLTVDEFVTMVQSFVADFRPTQQEVFQVGGTDRHGRTAVVTHSPPLICVTVSPCR